MAQIQWVGIGYFLPATPSKARVYVWRRLKALGAQTIKPGMAALPNSPENVEKLTQLCEKIQELSGEAMLVEFNFLFEKDLAALQKKFADATEKEYKAVLDQCATLLEQIEGEQDAHKRASLEQQLAKTIKRSQGGGLSQPVPQSSEIERTMGEIMDALRSMPGELKAAFLGRFR